MLKAALNEKHIVRLKRIGIGQIVIVFRYVIPLVELPLLEAIDIDNDVHRRRQDAFPFDVWPRIRFEILDIDGRSRRGLHYTKDIENEIIDR